MFNKIDPKLQELLTLLLNKNIELIFSKDLEGELFIDLNTLSKSHLYLYPVDGDRFILKSRYNDDVTLEYSQNQPVESILKELCLEVSDCICGRDFMNSHWLSLLNEFNISTT